MNKLILFQGHSITDDYWLYDGVHPTAMGHELITREWIKAFRQE